MNFRKPYPATESPDIWGVQTPQELDAALVVAGCFLAIMALSAVGIIYHHCF